MEYWEIILTAIAELANDNRKNNIRKINMRECTILHIKLNTFDVVFLFFLAITVKIIT